MRSTFHSEAIQHQSCDQKEVYQYTVIWRKRKKKKKEEVAYHGVSVYQASRRADEQKDKGRNGRQSVANDAVEPYISSKRAQVELHEKDHPDVDGHGKGPPRIRLHEPAQKEKKKEKPSKEISFLSLPLLKRRQKKKVEGGGKGGEDDPPPTYHSKMKPWAWHSGAARSRFIAEMPSYAIRQATQAPMLAMDAKKMKVLGMVRSRLKTPNVTKTSEMPSSDSVAPMRSTALSVLTWAWSSMANSRSSARGTSMVDNTCVCIYICIYIDRVLCYFLNVEKRREDKVINSCGAVRAWGNLKGAAKRGLVLINVGL